MKKLPIILFSLLLFTGLFSHAQQDTIAQLQQTYQTAMGLLTKLQRSIPKDSAAINQEWQRLHTAYKQLSDSLQQRNHQSSIQFEAQRLIDVINYRHKNARLDQQLRVLYQNVDMHQNILLEDDAQFTKIAQSLMGLKPEGETNESKIIAYNAGVIQDFYKQLDTSAWSEDQHQRFITTFATAYLKIGSVRKAEKLYRYFDSLFVQPTSTKTIKNFSVPDSISFYNPYLMQTTLNWASLEKGKVVIHLKGENLFDFVYLVSLMRVIHREYAEEYDIVLVRPSQKAFSAYLGTIKQNLAFSDYYIATYKQETVASENNLPAVMMVNTDGEVTYQANHTNALFKKLHLPIEAQKEQKAAAYWADIDRKKDSLRQLATQTKDSISYRATHENITFILKGSWGEDLTTELTPISWGDNNKQSTSSADQDQEFIERSVNKPYMAEFKVQHPQYPVYQLPVLVTGNKQEITISSGFPNDKEVSCAKKENAAFYKALQTIDKNQAQIVNYSDILERYPFQNNAFMSYLREALEEAKGKEQQAINSVKKAKKLLKNYADEKRKQMQMIR
jgi:hypothetical protein